MEKTISINKLQTENEELKARLAESEATLNAIRNGEVDAIVVSSPEGDKIFTLQSAETPYRIIIEEMDEGAVTVSEEGTILFCNRRFAELISVPIEQIIGHNFNSFLSDENKLDYHLLLQQNLNERIINEIVSINKDNEQKYLHISICLLPEGMLGKICIIVTDISELKKHQKNLQLLVNERTSELKKANSELIEINATKDKLFSIIAHDLRGPFTSLLGFSDLLIENVHVYDIDKFEKLLFHINSAAKSAYTLLENLLIWARSQNGQLLFKPRTVIITNIIKDVVSNLTSLATIKSVSIILTNTAEVTGYVDENMLNAIIRNLISNAIKFCNPGGIIEINAIPKLNEVEISVSDNGVGMTDETKSRLFRIESGTSLAGTAHEKGTGLGLILCREFVEKHGGKIWVESTFGKGSKFIFTLPNKKQV